MGLVRSSDLGSVDANHYVVPCPVKIGEGQRLTIQIEVRPELMDRKRLRK